MPQIKGILFWVFIVLFILTFVATLLYIFFGIGHLEPYERKTLFSLFIAAMARPIFGLFKDLLGPRANVVSLNLTDNEGKRLIDLRKYNKRTAICSPRYPGWEKKKEKPIECEMLYSQKEGLIIEFKQSSLPAETNRVFVTISDGNFGGSFKRLV